MTGGGPSLTGFLAGVLGDEEEDGGDEDRLDGTVRGPGPRGAGGVASEAHLARRLTKGRKSRRILSNKPQDFQVGTAGGPHILVLPPSYPASSNCSGRTWCYEQQPNQQNGHQGINPRRRAVPLSSACQESMESSQMRLFREVKLCPSFPSMGGKTRRIVVRPLVLGASLADSHHCE